MTKRDFNRFRSVVFPSVARCAYTGVDAIVSLLVSAREDQVKQEWGTVSFDGPFEEFFRSADSARDKYLARLLGLFSEHIVRIWCANPRARYEDLGRPTIYETGQRRGSTIDFTLRSRESGKAYVAELKCELEYQGYRYLRLTSADHIRHHTATAFTRFLRVAEEPSASSVRCNGKHLQVDGAILVWGAVSPAGKKEAIAKYSFADVLSLEAMIVDLQRWKPAEWTTFVDRYRAWTVELFDFLA